MMQKVILIIFSAVLFLAVAGCAADEAEERREFAEDFVTAAVDGDADEVWESFSPECRDKLIMLLGKGDEDTARNELLKIIQEGMKKRYSLTDVKELEDDEKLFAKAVEEVLNDPEKKFVKVDGEYFLCIDTAVSEKK